MNLINNTFYEGQTLCDLIFNDVQFCKDVVDNLQSWMIGIPVFRHGNDIEHNNTHFNQGHNSVKYFTTNGFLVDGRRSEFFADGRPTADNK